jgi:hypothetical protein
MRENKTINKINRKLYSILDGNECHEEKQSKAKKKAFGRIQFTECGLEGPLNEVALSESYREVRE